MKLRINPSLEETEEFLNENIAKKRFIILLGSCKVDYIGRAKSTLTQGERVILIKRDGSVLIHKGTGYQPVNWQPPPCTVSAKREGDSLKVTALRIKPLEKLEIHFSKINLVLAFHLQDEGVFDLLLQEEVMKKAVLTKPEILEQGFKPLETEKRINSGFIDLYGLDREGKPVIVEFKRRKAEKEDVDQLLTYVAEMESKGKRKIRGVLVAPSISKPAYALVQKNNLEFKKLTPKECQEMMKHKTIKITEFFKE